MEHFNSKSQRIGQLVIDKKFSELTILHNSKKGFQITSHYTTNMRWHWRNLSDEEKTPMCCYNYKERKTCLIRMHAFKHGVTNILGHLQSWMNYSNF